MALTRYEDIRFRGNAGRSAPVGITATDSHQVGSSDWTLTIPSQGAHGSSGVVIQVNNSRAVDPTTTGRYASPTMMGLESVQQSSASAATEDPDFEQNWITFATITEDKFIGSGNWRYIRLATDDSNSGLPAAMSAFLHSYHLSPMV